MYFRGDKCSFYGEWRQYAGANSVTDALAGVTLNLVSTHASGSASTVNIQRSDAELKSKLKDSGSI